MNQYIIPPNNIERVLKPINSAFFSVSRMPPSVEERRLEFETEQKLLEEEKKKLKALKQEMETVVSPTVKRRRKAKETEA